MTDVPAEDPRDALIREQAVRLEAQAAEIAGQAEQIAALEALIADLREQLAAGARAGSRNSGNSSMPPSSDDLPGRTAPEGTGRRNAPGRRSRGSSRAARARP